MPRLLAPLLLVALLAGPSLGQDPAPAPPAPVPPALQPPRIVLPDSILPNRLVRITVVGDFDSSILFIEPAELADTEDKGDGHTTIMTGPPGWYVVQATTIKGGKLGKARAVFVIPEPIPPTPPTPTPEPDDKPKPKPPPPPAPPAPIVSGVLNASLVVDLATLTPELAALREGINVRAAFPTDFIYRTYAAASPDVARLNFKPFVDKAGGPPVLIVQAADGSVVAAEKAPATEAEMIARIKQLKGGK